MPFFFLDKKNRKGKGVKYYFAEEKKTEKEKDDIFWKWKIFSCL